MGSQLSRRRRVVTLLNMKNRIVLRQPFIAFMVSLMTVISLVNTAQAAILFEGWSKVLVSGEHVGYIVQRYEFDEKKKEFKETHFLKTGANAGGLQESLVARADASFKPIAYQYTGLVNNAPMTVDASFKGDKMTAIVTEGKTKKTVSNTMPKGTFLSAFLGYVMLQGKEGLKKGVKYEYQGILEESATISKGEAFIAEEEAVSGIPAFRILNNINGSKFISLVTHKGEVLGTTSPAIGTQTILVSTMEEAVAGFGVNSANLATLFGSMPTGRENEIVRRGLQPPKPAAKPGGIATPAVTAPTAPVVNAVTPAVPANSPAVAPPTAPGVSKPAVVAPTAPVVAPPAQPQGKGP